MRVSGEEDGEGKGMRRGGKERCGGVGFIDSLALGTGG